MRIRPSLIPWYAALRRITIPYSQCVYSMQYGVVRQRVIRHYIFGIRIAETIAQEFA